MTWQGYRIDLVKYVRTKDTQGIRLSALFLAGLFRSTWSCQKPSPQRSRWHHHGVDSDAWVMTWFATSVVVSSNKLFLISNTRRPVVTMYIRSVVLAAVVGFSTAFVPSMRVAPASNLNMASESSSTEDRRSFVTKVGELFVVHVKPDSTSRTPLSFLCFLFFPFLLDWICRCRRCTRHHDGSIQRPCPSKRRIVENVEANPTSFRRHPL